MNSKDAMTVMSQSEKLCFPVPISNEVLEALSSSQVNYLTTRATKIYYLAIMKAKYYLFVLKIKPVHT